MSSMLLKLFIGQLLINIYVSLVDRHGEDRDEVLTGGKDPHSTTLETLSDCDGHNGD